MNCEFIRYLPSFTELRSTEGELIIGNDKNISLQGFKSLYEAEGTTYLDFKCDAGAMHESFSAQTKLAIERKGKPQNFLTYCKYSNDQWIATFGSNTLIYKDQKPYGVLCSMEPVENNGMLDLSRFVFTENFQSIKSKDQFSFTINGFKDDFDLTEREKQVVFHLIRGRTSKTIADRLKITKRTVDFHLDNLKTKLNCPNKEALVEKLIAEGFMSLLPESMFPIR
ncbi:MAG: hypothetical protein HRU09_15225 [Oligoflexales bacterium]|nr:hypothetical protein [Oligoflexales bacterium]